MKPLSYGELLEKINAIEAAIPHVEIESQRLWVKRLADLKADKAKRDKCRETFKKALSTGELPMTPTECIEFLREEAYCVEQPAKIMQCADLLEELWSRSDQNWGDGNQ